MTENKEFETIDFWSVDSVKTEQNQENKNIFSDFEAEKKLENNPLKKEKDIFDTLSLTWKILQGLFVFLFLGFLVWVSYVYIQKSETFNNSEILNPICWIFNWDLQIEWNWCSSISYNNKYLEWEIESVSKSQVKLISWILPIIYEKASFLNTKEIQFLISKSWNKLKVLDILSKFNYFKSDFVWIEKKKLQCSDYKIDATTKTLSMKCEAFSKWYTWEIIWFSWNKNIKEDMVNGTSISIANSFINYLEKNWKKYFLVIDRQKVFESEVVKWTDWYTNKTSFDLKLKIIY